MAVLHNKGCWFISIIFLILWPIPIFASSITMEYQIGFNDRFQLGKWTPINILVENRGRDISGTLQVTNTSGSEYRGDVHSVSHTMDIELPTYSKKRYSFIIQLNSFSHPLRIQIVEAGNAILTNSINLRSHYVHKGLGILATEKASEADLSMFPNDLYPVIIRPQDLPESWYGYDGVNMLIMHAHILETLNDQQYLALEEWIKRGGFVVFTGGLHLSALMGERINGILSITVSGLEQMTELTSMDAFCGQPLTAHNPLLVIKAMIKDATVLLREKNIPIITLKDMGLGKMIFMAFDIQAAPFRTWSGRKNLGARLYTFRPNLIDMQIDLDMQGVFEALVSAIPSRFPNIILSIIIGVLYLVLIIYFFNRMDKKQGGGPRTLISFFVIIGIFSLIILWLFFFKSPQKALTYNRFIYLKKGMVPSPIISYKEILGWYALKNTTQRFYMDSDHPPLVPLPVPYDGERYVVNDMGIKESDPQHAISVPISKWSHRFLTTGSMTYLPIQGTVTKDKDELHLSWMNQTKHKILDCHIYFNGHVFQVGQIDSSSQGEIKVNTPGMLGYDIFKKQIKDLLDPKKSKIRLDPFLEIMKTNLFEDIVTQIHTRYQSKPGILCLFGWIESNIVPYRFEQPAPSGEGVALFEWEMKIEDKVI